MKTNALLLARAGNFKLEMPSLPEQPDAYPMIRGLDAHESREDSFVAGTDGCDIWEVDSSSRTVIDGHTANVHMTATHPDPKLAHMFVTADESGTVFVWDSRVRCLHSSCLVGFKCCAIDISSTPAVLFEPVNHFFMQV